MNTVFGRSGLCGFALMKRICLTQIAYEPEFAHNLRNGLPKIFTQMLKKTISIILSIAMFLAAGYILVAAYPDFKTSNSYISKDEKPMEVTLEFWGLWDDSDSWDEIIRKFENKTYNFNGQKTKVSVNYTKKEMASYESDLLQAKQKNNEPDIFTINNNWLGKYADRLKPLEANKAYADEYNLIKYEELLNLFPAETIRNLIYEGKLYGLPIYSDSLALYYNKDLFKKAGIETPPQNWKEFKETAKKLTIIGKNDDLVQSGAALGSGENVNRSSDILALLMIQDGTKVIDGNGDVDINKEIQVNATDGIEKRDPGKRAIIFYTEFSDPHKETYSWNREQEDSVKAFADQKTAMIINYSYQMKNLLALNPDLNYDVSPMPQLENSTVINFSNIWTPVVSKNGNCKVKPAELSGKADCAKIAWSFLSFASQKENSMLYLNATGKAAARKDLLAEQINSSGKISAFASQAETAVSYNKFDDAIDGIFTGMIDEINSDRENWEEKADKAVEEIKQLTD